MNEADLQACRGLERLSGDIKNEKPARCDPEVSRCKRLLRYSSRCISRERVSRLLLDVGCNIQQALCK